MGSEAITHREIRAGGLTMHVAEAGTGPLVLLLHGFPECWYSWRHQLVALAAAGFHAVAPDQRGYCRTGGPAAVEEYTILHLTGDVIALMDALGEQTAVVAGHDWGAPVAWHTALLRPDRVRGVVGLSVPYFPRGSTPPITAMRRMFGDGFYMVHFQQPGVADAELAADVPATFRRLLSAASGEAPPLLPVIPPGGGFMDVATEPPALPKWLTSEDIQVFAAEYQGAGFTGPLNWYRNIDRNWSLTAPWHHAPLTTPAAFIAGDRDFVVSRLGGAGLTGAGRTGASPTGASPTGDGPAGAGLTELLRGPAPGLRDVVLLPGCGHWTQQERPAEVSDALISFARSAG